MRTYVGRRVGRQGKGGGVHFVVARQTYKSEKLVRGVSTPAEVMVSLYWHRSQVFARKFVRKERTKFVKMQGKKFTRKEVCKEVQK